MEVIVADRRKAPLHVWHTEGVRGIMRCVASGMALRMSDLKTIQRPGSETASTTDRL